MRGAASPVPSRRAALSILAGCVASLVLAACGSPSPGASGVRHAGGGEATGGGASASASPSWIRDSITHLDVFAPDGSADYYFDLYDTFGGARTVIDGVAPNARYWSFTLYPSKAHLHDYQIAQVDSRYHLTLASDCAGTAGSCISTGGPGVGVVVMRLYVPVDSATTGTGGVPLPTISYQTASGAPADASAAPGWNGLVAELAPYRARRGVLPAALTRSYPPAPAVETPRNPPAAVQIGGQGQFANPDNSYVKLPYSTANGDLVVSAEAPTYQADSAPSVNDLGRPTSAAPQSRYWSLCTDLEGDYTSACLRDEQVHLQPGTERFVIVVAPQCPVAGYLNCLAAGPQPLQRALLFRVLLPSPAFVPLAFSGPYALTATYVARRS
jgi:hypothetical protein